MQKGCKAKILYGTNHPTNLSATQKIIAPVDFEQCRNSVTIERKARRRKPQIQQQRKPPTVFSFHSKPSATSRSESPYAHRLHFSLNKQMTTKTGRFARAKNVCEHCSVVGTKWWTVAWLMIWSGTNECELFRLFSLTGMVFVQSRRLGGSSSLALVLPKTINWDG